MNCVFIVFLAIFNRALSIYITNTSITKRTENNPAIWTESEIWGPALEDWALTNHREKRVMKIPISEDLVVGTEKKPPKNESASFDKESKISPGKIQTKPPPRQVSETDLYLLGAIEKLVYRVDFMEKRLRRVEEMLYYVMAGNRIDQEPCPENFSRAGTNCYFFASNAGREMDWKAASKSCKKIGAALAEMETIEENQDVVAFIQTTPYLKGKDFWTGGLNPGLLWIWSNSARPVPTKGKPNKKNPTAEIPGDGRCLRLAYDPALRNYSYKGTDCGLRYSYICELPENSSSNQIRRLGRSRKILDEF